jgi:hypothetical protein
VTVPHKRGASHGAQQDGQPDGQPERRFATAPS